MTTLSSSLPLAARLVALIRGLASPAGYVGSVRPTRRTRALHDLDYWLLRDIGLERDDVMSPEARRAMHRPILEARW